MEIKCQLDATEVFIADLIACNKFAFSGQSQTFNASLNSSPAGQRISIGTPSLQKKKLEQSVECGSKTALSDGLVSGQLTGGNS